MSSIQNTIRWRSDLIDGAVGACCLGTPGQTKVSGDRHRETSLEICCLAAELSLKAESLLKLRFYHHFYDGKKPELSHFLMTIKIILLNPYLFRKSLPISAMKMYNCKLLVPFFLFLKLDEFVNGQDISETISWLQFSQKIFHNFCPSL